MTPLGIEPLAQCLNHLRHRIPPTPTPRVEQMAALSRGFHSNYLNAILFQLYFF